MAGSGSKKRREFDGGSSERSSMYNAVVAAIGQKLSKVFVQPDDLPPKIARLVARLEEIESVRGGQPMELAEPLSVD
jgi:hypothetical protein